jgi:hypothetical protein
MLLLAKSQTKSGENPIKDKAANGKKLEEGLVV